ncbi:MAG: AmmeMemoRadiSam system radical SAM enzyme [Desulforhopalus sp.]|nr:AmmeMemoRadiSam system radical SAM enzyme [Desulforhopalus sp.]
MTNNNELNPSGARQWWEAQGDGTVRCGLCAHQCCLRDGQRGICGVRIGRKGRIDSLVYGRVVAEHIDPIEKKPIFHMLPGSLSYSIATFGCNFRCMHCQNAGISQVSRDMAVDNSGTYRSPDEIVALALAGGCQSVSYTYVEPTVFFEYAYDCCLTASAGGLKNVFVSNGYMTKEVIARLTMVLTAINIDLKSFSNDFYKKICGARLSPVLDAIGLCRDVGIWVEVTTLVIPGLNDSDEELKGIASFLAKIDPSIPWHVSGYHPAYRMAAPPTPEATLRRAQAIGLDQGLHYVYTGNRPGSGGEDTYCPGCGLVVISRKGFRVAANRLIAGACPQCGTYINGVWR